MKEKKAIKKTSQVDHAIDFVVKISEIEALKFGKMDAEIRNAMQAIQISHYKKKELKAEYDIKCKQEDDSVAEFNAIINRLKPEYDKLIEEFVKKYNIKDKNRISIDPDTGIIREID